MAVRPGGPLRGELRVPGDKSISHRALLLAALADGVSSISGLSDGADVAATAAAVRA
ncbi:MAG: 3-phosphoshikimate 1-carboxyvinyltransferase, partial [Acidimicrobiia bacterium]|nr:3-phosphoshikimate 1-carboxyvinyltransferase [Acidimicrobiia bacterium]